MVHDGTLDVVFSSASICSEDDFLTVMKRPTNVPVVVFVNGQMSGIAWINGLEDNYACAHFCFFKEVWGTVSLDIGKKLLDYWMQFSIDVLIGKIPASNQKAISFVKKLGFKYVGEIPYISKNVDGDRVPTVILYYSRDEHGERRTI